MLVDRQIKILVIECIPIFTRIFCQKNIFCNLILMSILALGCCCGCRCVHVVRTVIFFIIIVVFNVPLLLDELLKILRIKTKITCFITIFSYFIFDHDMCHWTMFLTD